MHSATVLLTGLPRSGTTLTCALLNDCPDTVALAEPLRLDRHGERDRAVGEIGDFIARTRHQILTEGTAESTHVGGVIPDNWLEEPTGASGPRRSAVQHGTIQVKRPLSPEFRLIVKQPGEFSGHADPLAPLYPQVALVRHPLAVHASWQTVGFAVSNGHLPMAETFNPELSSLLAAIPERLDRQVALLGWLLTTYSALSPCQILRYEDLVADPVAALSAFAVRPPAALRPLTRYDPAHRYRTVNLRPLAEALMDISAICERFYPDFRQSLRPVIEGRPLHD